MLARVAVAAAFVSVLVTAATTGQSVVIDGVTIKGAVSTLTPNIDKYFWDSIRHGIALVATRGACPGAGNPELRAELLNSVAIWSQRHDCLTVPISTVLQRKVR
jgi:hypothetical protein